MSQQSHSQASIRECIAHNVRSYRSSRGLTQEKLALDAGLSPRHLQKIEAAELNVTIDSFVKMASALKVNLNDILSCNCVTE